MEISKVFEKLLNFAYLRDWHIKLAKGNYTQEISLLGHSYSTASILYDLMRIKKQYFTDKEIELGVLAAFLHDLDKETKEFQEKLTSKSKKSVEHLPSLKKFIDVNKLLGYNELEAKYAYACLLHTHLETGEVITVSSLKSELNQELLERDIRIDNILWIGELIRISDWFSSSVSPTSVQRSIETESFSSLIEQIGLKFAFFETNLIRGRLTYILLNAAERALKNQDFICLVNYPNGIVAVSETKDIDTSNLLMKIEQYAKQSLIQLFTKEEFLSSNINLQINKSMIGSNEFISLESLTSLIELGRSNLKQRKGTYGVSGKEQNEALFIRFFVFMIQSLKDRITEKYTIDTEKIFQLIDDEQKRVFGCILDSAGKSQKYSTFRDLLHTEINTYLIENEKIERSFDEMDEKMSLDTIERLGLLFFNHMQTALKDYTKLSIDIDQYLKPLLSDIQIPYPKKDTNELKKHISKVFTGYLDAKESAMGSIKGKIRCPICGTVQDGVEAKSASVGAGTKKFMNLSKGYSPLNKINICHLCVLEGTMRDGMQETFYVIPEAPFSPSQISLIHRSFRLLLLMTLRYDEISENIINGDYQEQREKFNKEILNLIDNEKKSFIQIPDIQCNYLVLTRKFDFKTGNDSTHYALLAMSALYMVIILPLKVVFVQGFDLLNLAEFNKAFSFPTTPSLLSALDRRDSNISFTEVKYFANKIATAYYLQLIANLSKRSGILDALRLHPGRLLERISIKRKKVILDDKTFKIFENIKVNIMNEISTYSREQIPQTISELLDKYYWQKSKSFSMHAILGPVNALYENYRKTSNLNEETAAIISGKIFRQLENLTKRDTGLFEAADKIYKICKSLNLILSKMNIRQKKKYLDDLRYSVYLLRVMKINEKYQQKKSDK